jgi:hypothetical protein
MLARVADPDAPPQRIILEPRLIVRESCGSPPRADPPVSPCFRILRTEDFAHDSSTKKEKDR